MRQTRSQSEAEEHVYPIRTSRGIWLVLGAATLWTLVATPFALHFGNRATTGPGRLLWVLLESPALVVCAAPLLAMRASARLVIRPAGLRFRHLWAWSDVSWDEIVGVVHVARWAWRRDVDLLKIRSRDPDLPPQLENLDPFEAHWLTGNIGADLARWAPARLASQAYAPGRRPMAPR